MRDDSEWTRLVEVRRVRGTWVTGICKKHSLWKLGIGWVCGLRNPCSCTCCMGNLVEDDATRCHKGHNREERGQRCV